MIEESRVNKDLHLVYLEIMNNRLFLIAILINLSVQVFGQDVVPRQAPIDNMSSFEDSMKNDKGDNPEFTKIPIIIDSNQRSISQRVTDELLRHTYINDYKTNKYNFKTKIKMRRIMLNKS